MLMTSSPGSAPLRIHPLTATRCIQKRLPPLQPSAAAGACARWIRPARAHLWTTLHRCTGGQRAHVGASRSHARSSISTHRSKLKASTLSCCGCASQSAVDVLCSQLIKQTNSFDTRQTRVCFSIEQPRFNHNKPAQLHNPDSSERAASRQCVGSEAVCGHTQKQRPQSTQLVH